MEKRDLIGLVLIDLMGKMEDASIHEMIAKSQNHGITKNIWESILEIHRLALAYRKAYESLCELLVVVSVCHVEKYYETFAESIHTLEAIGEIKIVKVVSEARS